MARTRETAYPHVHQQYVHDVQALLSARGPGETLAHVMIRYDLGVTEVARMIGRNGATTEEGRLQEQVFGHSGSHWPNRLAVVAWMKGSRNSRADVAKALSCAGYTPSAKEAGRIPILQAFAPEPKDPNMCRSGIFRIKQVGMYGQQPYEGNVECANAYDLGLRQWVKIFGRTLTLRTAKDRSFAIWQLVRYLESETLEYARGLTDDPWKAVTDLLMEMVGEIPTNSPFAPGDTSPW